MDKFRSKWLEEESCAHIHGWDFSHIHGRYSEEDDLPWSYENTLRSFLYPDSKLLDVDTGGGEFLLSLGHPYKNASATENYPPNIELCRSVLPPLGIAFRPADARGALPFDDGAFDVIANRHGDFNAPDMFRLLKHGGVFVTEQVGAENDRELVNLLLPGTPLPFPELYLDRAAGLFRRAGFKILSAEEAFRPIKFYDVGALVWFAHIIEREFPGFSVDACFDRLAEAQRILERDGAVEGRIHRFLLVAEKA